MQWKKDDNYTNVYYKEKVFNGFTYRLLFAFENTKTKVNLNIAMSSGKKRKDLEVFESKDKKSTGGVKVLLWALKEIEEIITFVTYYYIPQISNQDKDLCILIGWSDSKRRKVYSRLERYGFKLIRLKEGLTYMKNYGKIIR